jgi:predicted protein tyrosine phosphatase
MPEFAICSKSEVKKTAKQFGATHLISTLDPGDRVFRPPRILGTHHLQLWFEDEEDPSKLDSPTLAHAETILSFGKRLTSDARCLIHCWAGQCRSTAVGLALWLQSNGTHQVDEAVAWLATVRPESCPNLLLASHFDQLLEMDGELVQVCEKIGTNSIKRRWELMEDR